MNTRVVQILSLKRSCEKSIICLESLLITLKTGKKEMFDTGMQTMKNFYTLRNFFNDI